MQPDISTPSFWSARYRRGEDGWEKGRPAPPIVRLAKALPPGRVAVVGCGRGHEAIALAKLGWDAVGFDFAPEAVSGARRRAARCRSRARFERADLFRLPARLPAVFDAVCEHTCFCAIDPSRRREYVRAVAGLLKPGGFLFGLFYAHGNPGGPPFDTDPAEIRRLFGKRFEIRSLEVPPDSHPGREGKELLGLFYRRGSRRRQRR
mgnify:CR=1 FL=1